MKRTIRKIVWPALGVALVAVLVWLAGPARVLGAAVDSAGHPGLLAAAVGLMLLAQGLFLAKWTALLRLAHAGLDLRQSLRLFGTVHLVGFVTPGRTGEVAVAMLAGGPGGSLTSIAVCNRILESTWILCAGSLAAVLLLPGGDQAGRLWVVVPVLAMMIGALVVLARRPWAEAVLGGLRRLLARFDRWRPIRWLLAQETEYEHTIERFHDSNARLLRPVPLAAFTALMLAVWTALAAAHWMLMAATVAPAEQLGFDVVLAVMLVAALGMFVSPVPGGLGVSELGAVAVLHLLGYPRAGATTGDTTAVYAAFLLLGRLLLYGSVLVLYAAGRLFGRPIETSETGRETTTNAETPSS